MALKPQGQQTRHDSTHVSKWRSWAQSFQPVVNILKRIWLVVTTALAPDCTDRQSPRMKALAEPTSEKQAKALDSLLEQSRADHDWSI